MQKVEIAIQENVVKVKYRLNGREYEHKWEDCQDLSQKFLARLDKIFDKINKCNKNEINCLFKRKSDFSSKPIVFVLNPAPFDAGHRPEPDADVSRQESDSTTWRIVLIVLKALQWTNTIKIVST